VTITDVDNTTGVVTFTPALTFTHYGAASTTIGSGTTGTGEDLDTRAYVAIINRKVTIESGDDKGWGFRFLNYAFDNKTFNFDYTDPVTGTVTAQSYEDTKVANLVLQGVEFIGGGQPDTERTAFGSLNALSGSDGRVITGNSFHDCLSFCMLFEGSSGYEVNNNLLYKGVEKLVKAKDIAQANLSFKFNNNLMIGAQKRTTIAFSTLVACYLTETTVDNTVQIKNNVCQGSYGHGFAIPYVPCTDVDSKYIYNNLAGSCQIGFLYTRADSLCSAAADAKVYASLQCVMNHAPSTTEVQFKRFALADCYGRAFNLRFGQSFSNMDDTTAIVENFYINAISRRDCTYCYGDASTTPSVIPCANQEALRLLSITINGETLPDKFGTGYDVICRTETFDAKAFMRNIHFVNYDQTYAETHLSQCSGNYLFRPHDIASDMSGSHHFWSSSCTNCSM